MLLSSKTLHLAQTRKLRAGFVGHFRVWSELGRLPTDWISGGDSKMSKMSSMFLSFASIPLEAHLQIHPGQSK